MIIKCCAKYGLGLIASLLCLNGYAETTPLIADFKAKYNIIHDSDIVGKAHRTLKNLDDGSIEFSYKTDIEWFIFDDKRHEVTVNKLENNQLIPLSYKSDREGTGKNKYYHWQFDPENKTVTNLKKKKPKPQSIDWPEGLQSRLSYHLQSRINLITGNKSFNFKVMSNSAKVKNYHYEYLGEEDIIVPFGVLNAVKLKRQKPDSKKITYVWFAPSLNYLMVKLYQVESDFKQIHAELVSVESADKQESTLSSNE